MLSDTFINTLLANWKIELAQIRTDCDVAGSPNRTTHRAVLQTTGGDCLVLEAVELRRREQRERQFQTLAKLAQHGVSAVHPWLPTADGTMGVPADGAFWQLRKYIHGDTLPRETYGNDAWRGEAAASLLADVAQAATVLAPQDLPRERFLLKNYIRLLTPHIRQRLPALLEDIAPILDSLQDFLDAEPALPAAFAHGDFHPGNIIWSASHSINGLIDWEFYGNKTAGYDAANLLGCLGMDAPAFLTAPMAMAFVRTLREHAAMDGQSWHFLPDLMAALRFGWLREWIFQNNREMICQELDFIWLLLDNRELLRHKWQLA